MQLKQKLLNTGYFIDNEWLNKYIKLIENNKQTKKQNGITQAHHILQKKYFQLINNTLNRDNNENMVNLKYSDHILAHYYLMKCTTKDLYKANCCALFMMTKERFSDFDLEKFLIDNHIKYDEIYQAHYKQYIGENNPFYRKHHSEETKAKLRAVLKYGNNVGRTVQCLETGQVFKTVQDAADWCGSSSLASSIVKVCRGKRKTSGGYHWKYFNDEE